jgi:hypothetical protein
MSGKHAEPDTVVVIGVNGVQYVRLTTVNDLLKDISWRATRYAMDHDQTSHDVMTEAHTAIRQYLIDPDAVTEPCDCMDTHAGCAR